MTMRVVTELVVLTVLASVTSGVAVGLIAWAFK
jgi:hypothetical protein